MSGGARQGRQRRTQHPRRRAGGEAKRLRRDRKTRGDPGGSQRNRNPPRCCMNSTEGTPVAHSGEDVKESRSTTAPDHTAWARRLKTPLRRFLATQTGSAAVLLGATIAALAWANLSPSSYEAVWHTQLSIRLGGAGMSLDLHDWVNS